MFFSYKFAVGFCIPVLVSVHDTRGEMVYIGACANQQQDDEQEGSEVEKRRLNRCHVSN